jgi:hypothetical protein
MFFLADVEILPFKSVLYEMNRIENLLVKFDSFVYTDVLLTVHKDIFSTIFNNMSSSSSSSPYPTMWGRHNVFSSSILLYHSSSPSIYFHVFFHTIHAPFPRPTSRVPIYNIQQHVKRAKSVWVFFTHCPDSLECILYDIRTINTSDL